MPLIICCANILSFMPPNSHECSVSSSISDLVFFSRPNLYLAVEVKSPSMANDLRSLMVSTGANKWTYDGPTVIYCNTRKMVDQCADTLTSKLLL